MTRFLKSIVAASAALALAALPLPVKDVAHAAATTQTLHAYLCAPEPVVGAAGPRRVVNTSSTASPQPSYQLNGAGCAVMAAADVGFFLSQGFFYGPNLFSTLQTGITANLTAATSTLFLPAYAYIVAIIIEETAGNAVTGGVDCGDAGSATRFVSGFAVAANSTGVATLVAGQVFSNSGVPASDQVLCIAHTSMNSAVLNINMIYSYY